MRLVTQLNIKKATCLLQAAFLNYVCLLDKLLQPQLHLGLL
jgi:hypothetical protein